MSRAGSPAGRRLGPEFKLHLRMNPARLKVGDTLDSLGLNTVCRSAKCPNCNSCFSEGTATFLIMGPVCTRGCSFCAVPKGRPGPPDPAEPEAVAAAVRRLGLEYAVVTSVTRDDLPDGGAGHFVRTVEAIRAASPGTKVELLIPDFRGERDPLQSVFGSRPEVLNHNLETVPRLYPEVRPQADYRRSLEIISLAKEAGLATKSGLMTGLGESAEEVEALLEALAAAGCDAVTIGQYLAPSPQHRPIARFWEKGDFEAIEVRGRRLGMEACAGPLVRSSYRAADLYRSMTEKRAMKDRKEA